MTSKPSPHPEKNSQPSTRAVSEPATLIELGIPSFTLTPTSRGQSEIIGYVLIFSLVLSTFGTITVFGGPALLEAQSTESTNVMERNFDKWDSHTANTLGQGGNHSVEFDIPAGSLGPPPVKTEISINQAGTSKYHNISIQPMVFSPTGSSQKLIYDGGLLAVTNPTTDQPARVLSTPKTARSTGFISISLYEYQFSPLKTLKGPLRVQMFFEHIDSPQTRTSDFNATGTDDTSVTVTTAHPDVWVVYFEDHPQFTNVTTTGDQVTADLVNGRLRLTSHSVKIYLPS